VHPEGWTAKGHGRERTFQRDLIDPEEIRHETIRLADAVVDDLRREERPATHVSVKVRFSPFFTSTHGMKLEEPTMEREQFRSAALRALERFELDRPVRLIGVRAEMAPPVLDDAGLDVPLDAGPTGSRPSY
jgi:DNA polymerase-4